MERIEHSVTLWSPSQVQKGELEQFNKWEDWNVGKQATKGGEKPVTTEKPKRLNFRGVDLRNEVENSKQKTED